MYSGKKEDKSLRLVSALILLAALITVSRLFSLQVLNGGFYSALAMDTHEIYRRLFPSRGAIYFNDARDSEGHPAAVSRPYYLVYATPRDMPQDQVASTSAFLSETLGLTKPEEKEALLTKLSKAGDTYAQIAKKVDEKTVEKIKAADLIGIGYTAQDYRYYPELNTAAHVLGFLGFDKDGNMAGKYGVEGAWNDVLTGKSGFLAAERGALGGWISLAGRTLKQAEDGADFTLTIDRAAQYESCERLRKGFEEFKARSASLVVMDPKTGAVLAMCSLPDFDPNNYSDAKDISHYNNTAIFTPYEPGSVFKPITMAIALDLGLVAPDTKFTDPGERVINDFKIHNALNKKYGTVTMTEVLENSINTGMIWVEEKIGPARFKDYVEKFGFGKKTGISLDTESAGDVSSFSKNAPIYNANASFGQGFTVTPLQLAVAYSALANGGRVLKPRVIDEIRYPNGRVEKFEPEATGAVISPQTQKLINGMLISVVDNGGGYKRAKMDRYYVAAKTGTAQIAMGGKYSDESNHTFVGYFPATNPRFVLLVKYEAPQRQWAESTAAPVFKDVAKFLIDYYGIPPER